MFNAARSIVCCAIGWWLLNKMCHLPRDAFWPTIALAIAFGYVVNWGAGLMDDRS